MILIVSLILICSAFFGFYRLFAEDQYLYVYGEVISMEHISDGGEISTLINIEYKIDEKISCVERNIGSASFMWSVGNKIIEVSS